MSEIPEDAQLWLSSDNAVWLHAIADKHYGGDVEKALNSLLSYTKAMLTPPHNAPASWTALETLARSRAAGRRFQR